MNSAVGNLADLLISHVGADLPGPREGDFKNADGLLCCGTCREPKEKVISLPFEGFEHRIVRVMCKCDRDKEEEAKRRAQLERDAAAIQNLRSMSLMDKKFKDSTFGACQIDADNKAQIGICRRYAEKFQLMIEKNQGLLLWGPPGTGKTFAAACIANYLIEQKQPVMMTSFVKLVAAARGSGTDDTEAIIEKMNRASLLVIDELGAVRDTPYALEQVYNFIDSRYRAMMPMILTTNMTLQEMQATTDIRYARIFDRVFETCYPVEFKGESRRFIEAARRYDEMEKLLGGE